MKDRMLCRVLLLSAVYDWLLFVVLLAMPSFLFEFFQHPVPESSFMFRLAALPLLMAPVVYLQASRFGRSNQSLLTSSILLRLVGAVGILALLVAESPAGSAAYYSFAASDLLWAAAYYYLSKY